MQNKCCNTGKNESSNRASECCAQITTGCCEKDVQPGITPQKPLMITLQRLISNEKTCPRCGSTEEELDSAVASLKQALTLLGIKIVVEKKELSVEEFKKKPLESNRIWFNSQPLEGFVDADIGQSPCCDVCGPSECRTVTIDDQAYETIPSNVIVKAGLMAASKLIGSMDKSCC